MWGRDADPDNSAWNQLLYVGITRGGWPTRLAGHSARPWLSQVTFVTLEHYWNEAALRFAETDAIRDEHPIYNEASAVEGDPDLILGLTELEVVQGGDPRWDSSGVVPR
jgi:hypothetical protein